MTKQLDLINCNHHGRAVFVSFEIGVSNSKDRISKQIEFQVTNLNFKMSASDISKGWVWIKDVFKVKKSTMTVGGQPHDVVEDLSDVGGCSLTFDRDHIFNRDNNVVDEKCSSESASSSSSSSSSSKFESSLSSTSVSTLTNEQCLFLKCFIFFSSFFDVHVLLHCFSCIVLL